MSAGRSARPAPRAAPTRPAPQPGMDEYDTGIG